MSKPMNVFLSLFLTLFLFSCGGGGGGGGSESPAPGAKTLTKIDISADTAGTKARAEANPSTPLGISTQYSAIATYSDNTTEDITALATWSSADTSIATIDEKGMAKPLKISKTEITASYQGVTSNASTLTITDAIATKISVIPPTTKVAKGLSLQLQAIATLSDDSTKDVSTQASWQSNKPAVLKVDAKGKITAVALGDAIISATLQGVTGQTRVSAVNLTISKIQITPADLQLAIGTKTKLTAIATLNDKSVQDVSSQVAWLSSNKAVATVDGNGLVAGIAAGSTTLSASLLGVTGSASIKITNTSLKTLQVIPATSSIALGTKTQLQAVATFTDNSSQNISSLVQWSSSNAAVASVNSQGLVTGAGVGQVTISATFGSISRSATLTVTNAITTSIQITPAAKSLPKGTKQQYQAMATFSDNSSQDLTSQVDWDSSDSNVATIDLVGEATAFNEGNTIISAKFQSVTSNAATLEVTDATLTVGGLTITVPPLTLAAGQSSQLAASGAYGDGTTKDVTHDVHWSSSDPAIATVSLNGLVTAVAPGTATITGTLDGQSATLSVTVTNATLNAGGLTITVPPVTLAVGLSRQLTASGAYSDGTSADVTANVQWSSSDPAIATVSLTGLVTAVAPGTATITGTLDGQSATLSVTVTNATLNAGGLTITVPPMTLAAGLTGQLAANGSYSDGSSVNVTPSVSWTSNDPAVATVDASGLVTGVATGTATITGTLDGQSATLSVTVTNATLNAGGLTITVPPMTLAAGLTGQLAANGSYSDGSSVNVTPSVSWTSSDPAVATVDASGLVTGVTPGTATITGTLDGQSATLSVTITNATLNVGGLTITVPPMTLAVGLTGQLAASGTYSDGTSADVTANVQWSSDPAIATVSLTGLVTAVAPGTVTITGTLDGQSATLSVTVTNATINAGGLTITVPPMTLAAGQTGQLAANGSYSDGSSVDVTASVSWVSSDPAVATVDASGLVTGVAPGTATITGTLGGQSATLSVTVSNAVLNAGGLTIATPPLTLAAGLTGQLVANGSYSDGSNVNVTTSVSWSSSNPAVASVGLHTGLVTAAAPGIATITGTLNGETATLLVTVTNAAINPGGLTITVPPLTLAAGLTGQLVANGSYSDGSNLDVTANVSWTSSAPAVATVGLNTGLVTAVTPGVAVITGTLNGQNATLLITVTSAALNPGGLNITVPPLTLAAGLTGQLTAQGSYSDGSTVDVTANVSWTSSAPAIASVGLNSGLVTALQPGTATITGTLNGESATLGVTVSNAVVVSVAIAPISPLAAGTSTQLKVTATLSDTTTQDVSAQANWLSSNPGVFSVTSTGLATGVTVGSANVSVNVQGVTASLPVTVSNAVLSSLVISSTSSINLLNTVRTITFTAIGHYSDGSTQNVTSSATWRMNGGLLALGLGNTYVLVIPLGSTNFQAELNGVSSNILTFPGLIP
ncbi:Ig-like domain-containing protein [Aeromonas sp. sif2433]|uniref:beta strand repeat-containing protein n=1 Tax=Aeromonas sp. sif2433 TaxID=2854794 RepID=UPI001C44FE06|nr:Ig-like domain-containing protein [Aeromonas sp. sif2433]MBV7414186.1 Ig-like domain-containing protein [Aeromonas sp. sif2433]